ncbi:MAG: diguanylate cyclase [Bdellovibrionota bacterium]
MFDKDLKPSNSTRKIMVVDDDKDHLKFVRKTLEYEGYNVTTVDCGEKALQAIEDNPPHLLILDVNMPGISGIETLDLLRQKLSYVAVIFVSANDRPEDVIRGLDSGADDYIRKPFDIKELISRIKAKLRVKDLNDQLRAANEKLKELVEIDDLTGLFNMRSIYQRLENEIVRSQRFKKVLAIVMMDMDHFKSVNDQHDHLFGSYVLSEVGRIIRANIRKVDFAARYGGDEFLVAITETSHEGAILFADRLREKITQTLFKSGNDSIKLTASLGVAITHPDVELDARDLVRKADEYLYEAKKKGRNRVEFFDYLELKGESKDFKTLRKK